MNNNPIQLVEKTNAVGLIKKGYCWQFYIVNDSSKEGSSILCDYRGVGDLIGYASNILGINGEGYEEGLQGCEIEWNHHVSQEESDQYLLKERRIAIISLQVKNGLYVRKANKLRTEVELMFENKFSIIENKKNLSKQENFVPIALSKEYSLNTPISLYASVANQPNTKNKFKTSSGTSIGSTKVREEVAEKIKEFLGGTYTYTLLMQGLKPTKISESELLSESELVNGLDSIGIKLEFSSTDRMKFEIGDNDLVFGILEDNLTWLGKGNAAKKQRNKFDCYYFLRGLPQGGISFQTFWKELTRSPFSLSLIFVLSFIIQVLTISVPLLFQQIIDKVISQQNPSLLPVLTTVMITCALLAGTFRAGRSIIVFDIADRADEKFSEFVLRRLIQLKYKFFGGTKRGDIAGRITEVSTVRSFFTGPAISTILDLLFSVLYLTILLLYSVKLTIVAFCPIPIYMGIVAFGAPFYKKLIRSKANKRSLLISFILEVVGGIESVKLQSFGDKAISMWRKKYEEQQTVGLRLTTFGAILGEMGAFCTQLSSILILFVGATLVLQGKLTVGELIAFRIIAGYLTAPLLRLSSLWQSIQETQISLERVNKIVNAPLEQDSPGGGYIKGDPRQLVLRGINFSYDGKNDVINDVSFKVGAGKTVALVGRSGSGKSTLMKLITGLYDINSGEITLGGANLERLSCTQIRKNIYCVPQESHFIGGTVEDNIRYGWNECNQDELREVLADVCLSEISESQLGLNSPVFEGGANYSGGQKQRMALARMLIRRPSIVLLDEATSAMDSITERTIIENISNRIPDSSILFITHRVRTASKSDQVIVLRSGCVVGSGTFDDLSSKNEEFKNMLISGEEE